MILGTNNFSLTSNIEILLMKNIISSEIQLLYENLLQAIIIKRMK